MFHQRQVQGRLRLRSSCRSASPHVQGRYAEGVESLMRLREPAAWVALGALVLNLVLAVVAMATYPGPVADI